MKNTTLIRMLRTPISLRHKPVLLRPYLLHVSLVILALWAMLIFSTSLNEENLELCVSSLCGDSDNLLCITKNTSN